MPAVKPGNPAAGWFSGGPQKCFDDLREPLGLIVMHHVAAVAEGDIVKIPECGFALGNVFGAVAAPDRTLGVGAGDPQHRGGHPPPAGQQFIDAA